MLQLKPHNAGVDTARLLVNTTFGVLGFIDVGTKMGLQRSDEDFGQTLGYWGVGSGPYVMIPLLGPSTLKRPTNICTAASRPAVFMTPSGERMRTSLVNNCGIAAMSRLSIARQ